MLFYPAAVFFYELVMLITLIVWKEYAKNMWKRDSNAEVSSHKEKIN